MRRRYVQPRRAPRFTEPGPGLWRKIDAARQGAKAIGKNGKHNGDGQGNDYEFARAEDVVEEAKRVLSDQGLLILPAIVGTEKSWGQIGLVLQVDMEFQIIDVDNGESITLPWTGYGFDKPGDKAIYQGITGAKKYFFASLLEIPFVGIDPEEDEAPADPPTSLEAERVRKEQDRAAEALDLKEASA
jgi:hypothetical protein